jgi:DNA polymerase-3 subunit alpha
MTYVPLHVHSEYSLLDGLSQTSQISRRLEDIETDTCALTDHGTVSGAVDFSKTLGNASQKPILGCEFYLCMGDASEQSPENRDLVHQVVMAKNLQGWKDLLRLVSQSNRTDQFYYKPRIDFDQLKAVAANGNLISFSGHLGSYLGNAALENSDDRFLSNAALKLQDMFGKGNFFIEIQLIDSQNNESARIAAERLREIAVQTGIPPVATPDAHYPTREAAEDQRVLLCTSLKKTIGQVHRELKEGKSRSLKSFFSSNNYHIPSYEDMSQFHTEEELRNTIVIANMCESYDILGPPNPPSFSCPTNYEAQSYLRHLCKIGWSQKMQHIKKNSDDFNKYGERVQKELQVFEEAGLSGYFLIVQDILQFCRKEGYLTGPGRGSAAGCMVSYLIGITQIDPLRHDLVFERFYNAGRNTSKRISMPDIDIDVPKVAREKVINYMKQKYGKGNVAQIVTYQTLQGRSGLKRVMQARGNISFAEQNDITKHIMDESKIADELQDMKEELGESSLILWALKNRKQQLKDWCEVGENGKIEGKMSRIFEQAIRLEGTKIIQSKHAAGVVVSPSSISETCPMIKPANKGETDLLAGFEGPSCEDVGLLKLDVLGIRMLDKVMEVPNILRES